MHAVSNKLWLTRLVVNTLVVVAVAISVSAQDLQSHPQPRDFMLQELGIGWTGTLLGGFFGYVAFTPLVQLVIGPCPSGLAGLGDPRCELPPLIGYAIGSSLGTGWFVVSAGRKFGVEGNVVSAFLGATGGTFLGFWVAAVVRAPLVAIVTIFVTPAIIAVLGYNVGAKITIKAMSSFNPGLELASITVSW